MNKQTDEEMEKEVIEFVLYARKRWGKLLHAIGKL